MSENLIIITIPFVFGAIGYLLRIIFERKEKANEKIISERREVYQKFIDVIINSKRNSNSDIRMEVEEFYKKFILYASPLVVKEVATLVNALNNKKKEELILNYTKILNNIILSMRKDLGLKNKGINEEEILSILTN
jgi:hypothetical protein